LIGPAKVRLIRAARANQTLYMLRAEGPDFKTLTVRQVVENSPAAEAGVRPGDVISAKNDRPAAEFSLSQISKMFRQEGKEHLLEIIRGGENKQLKLKLRRLI
jgi:S1-C subfamily serine protease